MGLIDGIINNQIFGSEIGVVPTTCIDEDYEVKVSDYFIICDFNTEQNLTLPSNAENNIFIIKCVGIGNINFITSIDNIDNFKLYQGGAIQLICKNNKYYVVASAGYGI